MRTIGMFMNLTADDREKVMRRNAFLSGYTAEVANSPDLQKVKAILRHADRGVLENPEAGQEDKEYKNKANELANQHLDIYLASCWPTMHALINATTSSERIVVAGMFDPAPPNGGYSPKVYGFVSYDLSIAKLWVGKLKSLYTKKGDQINKVGVVYDRRALNTRSQTLFGAINNAAMDNNLGPAYPIDVRAYNLRKLISDFAASNSAGGLIVPAGTFTVIHRQDIISFVNDEGILAIYPNRLYVANGGLLSIGADLLDLYRQAGIYAAKLLKKQVPAPQIKVNDQFEFVVNSKVAKKQLHQTSNDQVLNDPDLVIDQD
jgi:putative tryptophan/tyrosine transport system substrate-binding protein